MKLTPGYYHFISANPTFTGVDEVDFLVIVYPGDICAVADSWGTYFATIKLHHLDTSGRWYISFLGKL